MSNTPVQTSATDNNAGMAPILIACFVIGHFLWNVLTPAHEFPMRTAQIMSMVFDLGMFLSLCGSRRAMPQPLFWIALAAGIGLFALRLTDHGWWTGHLTYSLPPR
jgi:hypothetical protein